MSDSIEGVQVILKLEAVSNVIRCFYFMLGTLAKAHVTPGWVVWDRARFGCCSGAARGPFV